MANERDEGLSALQRGDFETAARLLETATALDPADFWTCLYLGGAYHQLGRDEEAVQMLTRATQLQPTNAQAQYNLAIALERTGRYPEAIGALQTALALQPGYPLAQQALQRLQQAAPYTPADGGAPAAHPTVGPPAAYAPYPAQPVVPLTSQAPYSPPATRPNYGAPKPAPSLADYEQTTQIPAQPSLNDQAAYGAGQTLYGQPPQPAPPTVSDQTAYGAPPLYGQTPQTPPVVPPGYGQAEPTLYGQLPPPLYGQASQQSPGYNQPTPLYGPGVPPGGGYAPDAGVYGGYGRAPGQSDMGSAWYQDVFNPIQAFKDWIRIIVSPGRFFAEQAGRAGFLAPLSMGLSYTFVFFISMVIALLMAGKGTMTVFWIIGSAIGIGIVCVLIAPLYLAFAGLIHLVGKMFGSRAPYTGSLRAFIYSLAPYVLLYSLVILLSPLTMPRTTAVTTSAPMSAHVIPAQYSSNPGAGYSTPAVSADSIPFSNNNLYRSPLNVILILIGIIWAWILLGVGVRHIQRISPGGAVGVVVISSGVIIAIVFGIGMLVGVALLSAAH